MDSIKQAIVVGLFLLGAMAMFKGYGEEIFWLVIAALSGLGGYEVHKKQEAMKQKKNDSNTGRRHTKEASGTDRPENQRDRG